MPLLRFTRQAGTGSSRPRMARRATAKVAGLMGAMTVLALVGCQAAPASSTSDAPVATPTAPGVDATASTQANCLDPAIVAAVDELDSSLDTDPPIDEVADALEALSLEGAAADARDSFVEALRADPPDQTLIVSSLMGLKSQVALVEC